MQHLGMTLAGILIGSYLTGSLIIDSELIIGLLSVFSFLSHVLSFNNYATYEEDMQDQSKRFADKFRITGKEFQFWVSVFFFSLTVILTFLISPVVTVIAILLMMLWGMYTHPIVMLKKGRFVPFIFDLLTMPLLALFGFYLTGSITAETAALSVFFGIIEAAGHLNHMVIDRKIDEKTGIRTVAVKFGEKKIFIVSMILFIIGPAYFLLTAGQILPLSYSLIYMPGIFIPIISILVVLKNGFSGNYALKTRSIYRIIYLIESTALALLIMFSISYIWAL